MIKKQICAQFNNIFSVENVSIFRVMHHGSFWQSSSWNQELNVKSAISSIECNHSQIGNGYKTYNYLYEIVADIEEDCIKNYNIFNISVYDKSIKDPTQLLEQFDT